MIGGLADVLAEEIDDEDAVDTAERIRRAARSSAGGISRVGDLVSTLEEQDEPEPRDLRPILADVADSVDAQYDALTIEADFEDFEYRVFAGDLLDSVFTNVPSNAAVHNDDPVAVEVYAAERDRDELAVGFAEDGGGIAPEVRERIFQMGAKGPESGGAGSGSGSSAP